MKICYITGHFLPHVGGVEILFLKWAQEMIKRGNEVRVVTSESGKETGHTVYEGVDVYHYNWKIMFGHPIPHAKDMEEHIKWADLVHTTTFTVANPARKVAKKYNKPLVCTIHEVLGDKWYWIEPNKIKALAFRLFEYYVCSRPYDYVHVISESTQRDYMKFIHKCKDVTLIYNSVDETIKEIAENSNFDLYNYFGLNKSIRTFLYYGRPGQPKGIFVYENAIDILNKKYGIPEDVRFCFIISDDPIKQKNLFEKRAEEFGLSDKILTRKSVARSDLFGSIKCANYVVVPSITEGFGFCAAEACMLGKELIYSNGGSLPEVATGRCIPFENRDSESLAEILNKVINEGESAFDFVSEKDFSDKRMMDSFELLYARMLGKNDEK